MSEPIRIRGFQHKPGYNPLLLTANLDKNDFTNLKHSTETLNLDRYNYYRIDKNEPRFQPLREKVVENSYLSGDLGCDKVITRREVGTNNITTIKKDVGFGGIYEINLTRDLKNGDVFELSLKQDYKTGKVTVQKFGKKVGEEIAEIGFNTMAELKKLDPLARKWIKKALATMV